MYQVMEQSWEEKYKMYKKLSKKELISMLIEANRHLSNRPLQWTSEACKFYTVGTDTSGKCSNCGKNMWEHSV